MNYLKMQLRRLGEVKMGFLFLFLGILAGFLFAGIFKNYYWNSIDILDPNYLSKIKDASIDYSVLLRYVYWNIFRPFILLWVISATAFGIPYIGFCLVYSGFQCGFFLSVIFMKYSIKGILLIIGYTFPHYLIYIPVAYLCLRSGYWLCRGMYYDTKMSKRGRAERIIKHLIIIILLAAALAVGGLLETYVGSSILRKILVLF